MKFVKAEKPSIAALSPSWHVECDRKRFVRFLFWKDQQCKPRKPCLELWLVMPINAWGSDDSVKQFEALRLEGGRVDELSRPSERKLRRPRSDGGPGKSPLGVAGVKWQGWINRAGAGSQVRHLRLSDGGRIPSGDQAIAGDAGGDAARDRRRPSLDEASLGAR